MANTFDNAGRNALALAAASELSATKAELRTKLDRIETLLGYLTAKLLTGEAIRPTDAPVLTFFGISDKNPDPLKLILQRVAARGGARMLGVVECPSCGSNVHDIEGVFEETCSFCGATVKTET